MQRQQSTMTAAELQDWRTRHGHSLTTGAAALGVSRMMFSRYLAGTSSIPLTIELLAKATDRLNRRKRQ